MMQLKHYVTQRLMSSAYFHIEKSEYFMTNQPDPAFCPYFDVTVRKYPCTYARNIPKTLVEEIKTMNDSVTGQIKSSQPSINNISSYPRKLGNSPKELACQAGLM